MKMLKLQGFEDTNIYGNTRNNMCGVKCAVRLHTFFYSRKANQLINQLVSVIPSFAHNVIVLEACILELHATFCI
jgi:hypothetical protein